MIRLSDFRPPPQPSPFDFPGRLSMSGSMVFCGGVLVESLAGNEPFEVLGVPDFESPSSVRCGFLAPIGCDPFR